MFMGDVWSGFLSPGKHRCSFLSCVLKGWVTWIAKIRDNSICTGIKQSDSFVFISQCCVIVASETSSSAPIQRRRVKWSAPSAECKMSQKEIVVRFFFNFWWLKKKKKKKKKKISDYSLCSHTCNLVALKQRTASQLLFSKVCPSPAVAVSEG